MLSPLKRNFVFLVIMFLLISSCYLLYSLCLQLLFCSVGC